MECYPIHCSLLLVRSQILEEQGLLNQITRPCVAYPSLGGSQLSQVLNATEQVRIFSLPNVTEMISDHCHS